MRTVRFLCLPVFVLIIFLALVSCKHKKEAEVIPTYPLAGTWKGTTWQNLPVTLTVAHVDTGLFITSYDFTVKGETPATADSVLHLARSSANGMAAINDTDYFLVPIANINADFEYISGTINSATLKITGNIKVFFKTDTVIVKGTYTASKQK